MFRHIPNALTIFRILLIPVFLHLIFSSNYYGALAVFAVAGATDGLDGYIARRWNLGSELGANLDPLADKLLLTSAFVSLTYMGLVPVWLCVPVIARDAAILAGVLALRATGRTVRIAPTISGKLTTVLQIATVLMAMLFTKNQPALFLPLAALTLLFTIYSGLDYALREIKTQKKAG